MSKKSKVVKNFIYNTAYELLRLFAPLITAPYVSRVLGAGGVGSYSYPQSIATYFVLVGAVGTTLYGKREIAFVQDDPQKRTDAFWEIESFRFIAAVICTILYYFLFCRSGQYVVIYRILALEVLATAVDISWFFMGMENFRITVIRNTIIKLTGIALVFLLVKKPEDVPLYTVCMTLPILLGNLSLWLTVRRYLGEPSENIFGGVPKHIKPILFLFIPQIAIEVYAVLDKTMIGKISSSMDQVGYYTQAQKIVKIVLMLVTSLGTVMLPAMSAAFAQGKHETIIKNIKRSFRFVFMISFALLFGLCAISERFAPLFFGRGFEPVGTLMIIIAPIIVLIGMSNVIGRQYLLPTKQEKEFTLSVCAGAAVNVCFNLILIRKYDAIGASIATVIAELSVTLVQMWCVRKQLPLREFLSPFLRYLFEGGLMFLAVWGIGKALPKESVLSLLLMVACGIMVYIAELAVTKDAMLWQGLEMVKNKIKKV